MKKIPSHIREKMKKEDSFNLILFVFQKFLIKLIHLAFISFSIYVFYKGINHFSYSFLMFIFFIYGISLLLINFKINKLSRKLILKYKLHKT